MKFTLRFALMAALLLSVTLFLQARSRGESLPARLPLSALPSEMGEWVGSDIAIEPEIRKVLGEGDFLQRDYRSVRQPSVNLFVAYFPTQRTGSTIHSPQNCMPGAGWSPVETSRVQVEIPGRSSVEVNRFVLAKGTDHLMVLYWYQSNGRVVASEYWSKIFLVTDSVRRNRSDGALVRIVTPVTRIETLDAAQKRAAGFAAEMVPLLDSYIPR